MQFVDGLALPDADGYMATEIKNGCYQRSHLDAAMRHVVKHRTAVDCGAHVGTWTIPLSGWFERVVSFEPAADTFEALLHNVRGIANIELHRQALGKEPGRVTMTLEGFDRAIAMRNTGARFTKDGGEIERVTLDSLGLDAVDFIKMDIEGGEAAAMEGARKTLLRCKPVVLFEDKGFWRRYGYSRQWPHEYLTTLGMHQLERVSMDEIWGWA